MRRLRLPLLRARALLMLNVIVVGLGVFFLVSGLRKIRRYPDFKSALRQYDLWPSSLTLASCGWITAEALTGAWLITGPVHRLLPLAAAMGIASGAIARRVQQGASHDCGCSSNPHRVSARLVLKNLVLASVALGLAYLVEGSAATAWAFGGLVTGCGVGAATVGHSGRAVPVESV